MRTIVLTALLLITVPLMAQERPSPEEREGRRLQALQQALELSDAELAEIEPILAEQARQMRELRDSFREQKRSRATMRQMRDQSRQLMETTREQLATMLSPEQLERYDAFVEKELAKRMRSKGKRGR